MTRLLDLCVAALKASAEDTVRTPDVILANFCAAQQLDADTETFVQEVYNGCLKHHRALRVPVNSFFAHEPVRALRSDRPLYSILAYLGTMRLGELGVVTLVELIEDVLIDKLLRFFGFLTDRENILGFLHDEWLKVYDDDYVQTHLVGPLLEYGDSLMQALAALQARVSSPSNGTRDTLRAAVRLTQPAPFNLTEPHSVYRTPLEEAALERKRRSNRDKAERTARLAAEQAPRCAPTMGDLARKAYMTEQRARELEELPAHTHRARPVPAAVLQNKNVRLNAAAILREELRFRKQQEAELARLEGLARGDFDEEEMADRDRQARLEAEAQRLADVEKNVLAGQLSREEAILARQEVEQQNLKAAAELKLRQQEARLRLLEEQEREAELRKEHVEATRQAREQVSEAKAAVLAENQVTSSQLRRELEDLRRQAEIEAAADLERRADLIREIRALEAIPTDRTRVVDLTETGNHGLLNEMSIVELRARLDLLREQQLEEEELKRQMLFDLKLAKDEMLDQKRRVVEQAREDRAVARRQELTMAQQLRQTLPKADAKTETLRQTLAQRREQRSLNATRAGTVRGSTRGASRDSVRGSGSTIKHAGGGVMTSTASTSTVTRAGGPAPIKMTYTGQAQRPSRQRRPGPVTRAAPSTVLSALTQAQTMS
ncbi:uncharacterized protein MONBRDRAFT_33293 [Monosiga brevicollis MX1]|uniref:Cilia- and flagella-associated protein 99 n=1 Tax=Monosiga brevicollis TaxID=81824 RepID=A9V4L0_MONBE|nr:uncharacterized protein MONBRDRAFT_33293 [Monosiga brevicollis MX1]EDQ87389.1 predicted protein [Monosiga brevicollis MX1]|eukprot:XP_001747649.1 hypothetical protein [Monosiga brevicollis MX1]